MKKYILDKIAELKNLYPNEKISVVNGFLGVVNGERLKHTSYLGNAYFEHDGKIYTDYNTGNKSKLVVKL